MSVERVTVARIRCGHLDDHADPGTRCPSVLHVDAVLDDEQVRAAARERAWETGDRDRCPRHRGGTGDDHAPDPPAEPAATRTGPADQWTHGHHPDAEVTRPDEPPVTNIPG